jgi:hypothetical protein
MLLSSEAGFLNSQTIAAASSANDGRESVVWTDDHANVLAAFRSLTD